MEPRVLDQTGGGGGVGMRPVGGQGVRPPAGRPLRGQVGKQQHPWRFGQADNIWVRIDPLEPMVTMVLIHCTGIISLVELGAHLIHFYGAVRRTVGSIRTTPIFTFDD